MKKYGFIYIWYDRKHKRYYIGSHWGTEGDGYVCSSSWTKRAHKLRPDDFKRRTIERVFTDRKALLDRESYWLGMMKDIELGTRYYNLRKYVGTPWWAHPDAPKFKSIKEKMSYKLKAHIAEHGANWVGRKHSVDSRFKMSQSAKGRKSAPRTGMKWSEEAKQRNTGVRNQTPEWCAATSERMKGNKYGVGHKNHLGHSHSEEVKQRMSNSHKGKHDGAKNGMARPVTLAFSSGKQQQYGSMAEAAEQLGLKWDTFWAIVRNCNKHAGKFKPRSHTLKPFEYIQSVRVG